MSLRTPSLHIYMWWRYLAALIFQQIITFFLCVGISCQFTLTFLKIPLLYCTLKSVKFYCSILIWPVRIHPRVIHDFIFIFVFLEERPVIQNIIPAEHIKAEDAHTATNAYTKITDHVNNNSISIKQEPHSYSDSDVTSSFLSSHHFPSGRESFLRPHSFFSTFLLIFLEIIISFPFIRSCPITLF